MDVIQTPVKYPNFDTVWFVLQEVAEIHGKLKESTVVDICRGVSNV